MAKYVCTVCGYVYEGDAAPEICPVCKAPAEKFKLQVGQEHIWLNLEKWQKQILGQEVGI